MAIKTGEQYVARIRESRPDVWLKGERIGGRLTEHPAFQGLVRTQAALYDMQGDERYRARMTYESPDTGEPAGLSFLPPRTKKDLARRRKMMSLWAERHHGFLGRSPDYMNTAIMAFGSTANLFARKYPRFADNAKRYYAYCRDRDVTLSHAFVQPPAARLSAYLKTLEIPAAARVERRTEDGIVVSGAFLMTTQGATAEEILVYPVPLPHLSAEENPFAFVFAVPNNVPGLKFVCRENWATDGSHYDYPLSSRFDEMDTLAIFDRVLVPEERIFLLGDHFMVNAWFEQSRFHTHVSHQILARIVAKTEFAFGTLEQMVDTFGLAGYSHVVEKAAEAIAIAEALKAMLLAAEAGAVRDRFGLLAPNPDILYSANFLYPRLYPRIVEILQLIGAGSLIMIPGEKDFESENGALLETYLKAEETDARRKVALLRLAWEMSAGAFGGRQTLYERFFFGDATRVASRLYHSYTFKERYRDRVKAFLDSDDDVPPLSE